MKNEEDQVIKIADDRDNRGKKKDKTVKTSNRREIEEYENAFVDLDINIINQISSLKLSPPIDKSQIPSFLVEIEKKLQEFKKKSEEEKFKQRVR